MNKLKTLPKGVKTSNKKKDVTVIVAIIGAVVTITTTCITAFFAPAFLKWIQEQPTPIQPTYTIPTQVETSIQQPYTATQRIGNYVILLPSCDCIVVQVRSDRYLIRLRWGAMTRELAEQGADFLNYTLTVDGQSIQKIGSYRKPAVYEEEPFNPIDPAKTWWVYWDYPLPWSLPPPKIIEATFETLSAIDTGENIIPAGTKKTFRVEVHIVTPGNQTP